MLFLGQSQSGKTCWIYSYLRNLETLYPPHIKFKEILYFYGEPNAIKNFPKDLKDKVSFISGVQQDILSHARNTPAIIIFDDLYQSIFSNSEIVNLFCNSVHHSDVTVLLTTQVLFPKEKNARVLALNSQYIVFCPSPRTNAQFSTLAGQIAEPGERKSLLQAYRNHLSTNPRSPFFLDLHPQSENWCRYRTQIFDTDECSIVYCPLKYYNEQTFKEKATSSAGITKLV